MRSLSFRDYVLIVLVLLISMINYGCKKDHDSSTPSTHAGKLVFAATTTPAAAPSVSSRMVGAAAPRVMAAAPIAGVDFDLGELKTTDTYLFVLKNTGTEDVTNVVLSSDNPDVTVTPSRIGVLQPDGQGGVVPVIKVSVQHGISQSGLRDTPLLSPGATLFNVTATGDAGVTAQASMGVTVLVANFDIVFNSYAWNLDYVTDCNWALYPELSSTATTELAELVGTTQFSRWVSEAAYYPEVAISGHTCVIRNTGNANLVVTLYSHLDADGNDVGTATTVLETVTITAGSTYTVPEAAYILNGSTDDMFMSVESEAQMHRFQRVNNQHNRVDAHLTMYNPVSG